MTLPDDLRRPLNATALRIRLQRALDAGATLALPGLGLAGLVVALVKTEALAEGAAAPWLWAAGALPVLGLLFGALRPLEPLLAAKLLDRAHGLHDRVSNAVAFSREAERTPFMEAALEDARAHAGGLSASRAMPLRVPRDLLAALGVGVGVALLALVEVPRVVEERLVLSGIDPVQLHADELDAYESELRDLLDSPDTPEEVRDAAREFNRLVEDLADERLDRAEALRRITELEDRLDRTRPADAELMRESLEQIGDDMRRAPVAEELSQALRDGDAERAEAEMRRLAERLRNEELSRAEIERLRQALQRAADNRPEDLSEQLQQREEEMNRLLQRQREQAEQTPQERRLLQRRRRELDRLRREHQEAMERRRQLDRLQRELQQSAESLNQREQQQQSAEDLERAAEQLNRMAREQMSEEEMRRLQQQLAQLREMIRRARQQQAQNGQGQQQQQRGGGQGQGRMDRFVLRANGQGEGMRVVGPGQQGQEGQQPGQQQGQQGQPGGGQGQQQGGQGQNGQGESQEQVLRIGGDGEPTAMLEIPGVGESQQGQGQGSGQLRPGDGAGVGHDPTLADDPTRMRGEHQTVRVEGEHGEGPSRSQVIMGSAQRGFADRGYRDVYTDYSGHAEEVLERDQVPPGYRFYVRRYFQLIRPRD